MMAIIDLLVLVPLGVAIGYWLYSWWAVGELAAAAHRPHASIDTYMPGVSILKPLKGADPTLAEDLRSFCRQDWGDYEILCGVSDADDPAVRIVRRLEREFPRRSIRLIVVRECAGANPKSAILNELTRAAAHDVLVISDSDIRVTPDYLSRVVHPLRDKHVGLVTCAYRSESHDSLASAMSALYVDATLLPSIAVASHVPGVRFAFGATMALRRSDLMRGGGYAAIADHLADDYRIGAMLADLGLQTRLSDYIVAHTGCERSLPAIWHREIRWQRAIRAVEPWRYMGLPLTFGIPMAIVLLAITAGSIGAWALAGIALGVREISAFAIAGRIDAAPIRRRLFLLPLRDCLTAVVWASALFGRHVRWRGKSYRLLSDGRLAAAPQRASAAAAPLRGLVRKLDHRLREKQGIFEFTDDPNCLFRARIIPAALGIELYDGTIIAKGERILELHFWNERLAPAEGSDQINLTWAVHCRHGLDQSLAMVARFLESRPDLGDIRALGGTSLLGSQDLGQLSRIIRRFGLEVHPAQRAHGLGGVLRELGENMLSRLLIWTFNPSAHHASLRTTSRSAIWISRRTLRERYAQRDHELDRPARPAALRRRSTGAFDHPGRRKSSRAHRAWESLSEPRRRVPGRTLRSEADA